MAARVFTTVQGIGSFARKAPQEVFRIIFVPWRSSYGPIESFLNDESTEEQIGSWRDRKLAELTFVGITCALITGAVVQALTWPQVQTASDLPLGLWYSSLILSLVAICLATQHSVALNRVSSYKNYDFRIRSMLGYKVVSKDSDRGETWMPRKLQLYVWQTPIMHLNFGILGFVVGLGILVFERGNGMEYRGSASKGLDPKALAIVGLVGAFSMLNYLFSTGVLYYRIHSIEDQAWGAASWGQMAFTNELTR